MMKTYTAHFRTDADYATRTFKARSPQGALKQAHAFYDDHTEELLFQRYDDGQPVRAIAVYDEGDKVALWQDDELRLRHAAGELIEALELCVECLAELSRLDDGTPSVSALIQARAAIAKATGHATPVKPRRKSPTDPEAMNTDRGEWAAAALRHFQCVTGGDYEDSLGDLLGDSMHWADRENFDFELALDGARGPYAAETAGEEP
jgi:hypothetical protein